MHQPAVYPVVGTPVSGVYATEDTLPAQFVPMKSIEAESMDHAQLSSGTGRLACNASH